MGSHSGGVMSAAGLDRRLLDEVRARLSAPGDPRTVDDDAVRAALRSSGRVFGSSALADLTRAARSELTGAGPLQVLLDEPDVTDVLVNGPADVWVDRGDGLHRVDLDLGSPEAVRALAVRMAAVAGQRLDDAAPTVDARMPDGTRLHAVVPPVAPDGAVVALRVLRQAGLTLDGLVAAGGVPPPWVPLLTALVCGRANLLVSGGTGTGKTTLLAALLGLVPVRERILVVEEARELAPRHPHVVSLAARRPNVEGVGEVTLADLVRGALRMRPDRIVVGECRGAEVRELLLAMNTGHDGGMATVHANAAEHVPARLAALAALAGMPGEAVAAQGAAALDVVVHLRRTGGRRHLAELGLVDRAPDGALRVRRAATWAGRGAPTEGPAWAEIAGRWQEC
ncbi:TadA family conjugal transfer-associated ATPase [Isoptericola sp. NEAU-Y5]|uniref:TadA family conjugal transfer-associated ATPase n=1 Tax=Isoptericola luteus TaxID=2879484 RepID=A0ABS7ZCF0_9MICO|nr:TadA family conjugal transfer-associated ATPase [Isoptericola sp. NEAU-Y5]MCA5892137.1 TadA family conjugal transfer-associated ATPase [Isoptericola sp. NEAU-Y5]